MITIWQILGYHGYQWASMGYYAFSWVNKTFPKRGFPGIFLYQSGLGDGAERRPRTCDHSALGFRRICGLDKVVLGPFKAAQEKRRKRRREWPMVEKNGKKTRRPVSRVLSTPLQKMGRGWMAIHLGRPLPDASRDLPGRRRENPPAGPHINEVRRVAPIWSCSRWGLPCRLRCRRRGALLPHPFTLAAGRSPLGGLLSVALSLGSPPPAVNRHRVSVEPGLSSPRQVSPLRKAAIRPSGGD